MTRSIELITDNNRFQLSLVETNGKLSSAIFYYSKKDQIADETDWIFGELLTYLRTKSMSFLADYMKHQMCVTNLTKEDVTQLIEMLDEGKKWLNKLMPIPSSSLEKRRQEALKQAEQRIEEQNKGIEKVMFGNSKSTARRYNSGKRQWSLLHYPSIEEAIKVLEFGAFKYSIFKEKVTGKTISGKELLEQHGLDIMGSKAMGNYELISSGKSNWKNGLNMTQMKESAQRHLVAMMNGELRDEESGCLHSAHLMVNGMFINYYELQNQ